MAKTIFLKYAGRCSDCGTSLSVGTKAKWYGRGKVYGLDCHSRDSSGGAVDYSFRDPGGQSALRAGSRRFPCPTCHREDMLSAADVKMHYQCDRCADAAEGLLVSEY